MVKGIEVDMKQVLKNMDEFVASNHQTAVVTSAKRAAAQFLRKIIYADSHKYFKDKTGNLRASLRQPRVGVKVTRNKNAFVVAGYEGTLAPHAHLIEFGHNSSRNGPVMGKHFMSKPTEENLQEVADVFREAFLKAFDRRLNKMTKK